MTKLVRTRLSGTRHGRHIAVKVASRHIFPVQVWLVVGHVLTLAEIPAALADFQGGSPDSPVILPDALVGQITGNIGGAYSEQQIYGFNWEGGLFQTKASIFGSQSADSFQYKLWDSADTLISSLTLDAGNDFAALMTVGSLASGLYKIGLQAGSIPDPRFQIDFITPVGVAAAVPEPATWAMMIAGFGLVGMALRRSRPRIEVTFACDERKGALKRRGTDGCIRARS